MLNLGLASTCVTQHHMEVLRKFCSCDFWCVYFWVVTIRVSRENRIDLQFLEVLV
jgi:hypothetical protein